MDINKDINEYFKNDTILLIMDFLYSQDLIDSLMVMEKETKLSIFEYNKELSFIRKLIIEGNWEESENFLLPLKSNSNFQYNSAIKLIKLQQIYETIETRFDNLNQEEIIKQLKEIKDFLKEEEFKDLLNLLNKNSIKDIPKFNNWTVNRGRLKTFEQIKELFRVVYSNEKEDKIMKNNLLVNLLIKINGRGNISKNKLIEKINSFINEQNEKNNKINNIEKNKDNKNSKINNINSNTNKEKSKKIENRIKSSKTKDNSKIILKQSNINEKNKKVEKDSISKINNDNKLDSQIIKSENSNISNIPQYTETSSLLKETKKIISSLPPKKGIIKEEQKIITENMIYQKIESTYDLYSYDPSSFSMDSLIVDSKAIRAISFSSNGKLLSLGTNSKSLKLYDFSPINDKFLYRNNSSQDDFISLKLLFEKHNHHAGSIYCLDFSPSDKLIATGSNDKTIKIFVVPDFNENMKEVLELAILDQKGTIRSVLFPPTENNVFFSGGSCDNNINMWDTESGKKINSLIGHKECINSLKFSVDENSSVKLLGSCGNDNIICFHDYRTNNPVKKIEIIHKFYK